MWCNAREKVLPNFHGNGINGDGRKRVQCITLIRTTLLKALKACQELVKCFCKKTCQNRSKCKKFELPCAELGGCSGGC